jgi:exosome complex RNA-binding protein Rrp42 (RNase PH superfamily)
MAAATAQALAKLSLPERLFVKDSVAQQLRLDGRSCTDYRHFTVQTGMLCFR